MTWSKLTPCYRYRCRLTRVIDGDTIVVDIDLGLRIWAHDVPIRLAGIDAPDAEPAKSEATTWARVWLASREPSGLTIETTKTEKYGRWLGRVYGINPETHEPECLNDAMVAAGKAVAYEGGKK